MKSKDYEVKACDILIIGGGGSGAIACLVASQDKDLKIILASKGPVSQSGLTPTGNGGTASSGAVDDMFRQMVIGGEYLNDQRVIWFMVNEIQRSVRELEKLGVPVTPIGPRAVCVPGTEALRVLREEIRKRPNVALLEDVLVTKLLNRDNTISAATALDLATGKFFVVEATTVIIATGGAAGELYPYTSNNPFGVSTDASGTGHAMAYLAGAELIDMEMIQFVPLPANPRALNLRYFPEFWKGPYLNRFGDVVESNIDAYIGGSYSHFFIQKLFREIEKGNGPIYVDHRSTEMKDPAFKVKAWDRRRKVIRSMGIDPHDNTIEIIIGSHFCMGGIRVNERTETSIPGLYAAGEVMGGVHGGLRIAGFSFTQMIVFGFEAGKQAAAYAKNARRGRAYSVHEIDQEFKRIARFLDPKPDAVGLSDLKTRLHQVMAQDVFVFRDKEGLNRAVSEIKAIRKDLPRLSVPHFKRFNLDWMRSIEFSLMVACAEILAESALFREESRGFHFRRDFPEKNTRKPPEHTTAQFTEGHLKLGSVPVVMNRMEPEA